MIVNPDRKIGVVADDGAAFEAAAEMTVGQWAEFKLPVKNTSSSNITGMICFTVPECIELEVWADSSAEEIQNVTRIGENCWKFVATANATDCTDYLYVVVSVDDWCTLGYFSLYGEIKQISY